MPVAGWLAAAIGGLLGLLVGSFLNVLIHRLPRMLERQWAEDCAATQHLPAAAEAAAAAPFNLARPRSHCPQCGHGIRWHENIPLLSYALLRGRCSACRAPIGLRYPLIELATGLLFALCAWRWGLTPVAAAWAALGALLIAQFLIDLDTQLLPDELNYLILWGGLVATTLGWTGIPLPAAVWGAVFGYLSLWIVYQLHHALTGKEGMGHGDFKLLAGLGAWFGVDHLLALVLMSTLVGSLVGATLLLLGRLAHRDVPISFGPFLAGAGLLVLVIGPGTLKAWLPFVFPF